MRGTIGGLTVVEGVSAGFEGSFSADLMEGLSMIRVLVSMIRDKTMLIP